MEKKKFSTTKFVEMALLVAIILLMAFTPIGYIKTFGLEITLIVVPVFWNECIWRNAFKHQSGWNICCLCSSTYFDGFSDRTDLSGA